MAHLFCYGLGFTARAIAQVMMSRGMKVTGTSRSPEGVERLAALGFDSVRFHPQEGIVAKIPTTTTHLLLSASPAQEGDPVLATSRDLISKLPNLKWIGYLSTIGVYGNYDGAWIDETAVVRPRSKRATARVEAEKEWLAFAEALGKPVNIFRLAGIYGPGRNPLLKLLEGKSRRIDKPGQVFNRIHTVDIASVVSAAMERPDMQSIYNVCDDEPAAPQEVVAFAASLLGVEPPELVSFEEADLSPMARSFYADNKRVQNTRIKELLGAPLRFPTYREGLRAIAEEMGKSDTQGWRR